MTEQQFKEHLQELLPGFSEKAMAVWAAYAEGLDADGTEALQIFFEDFFINLDLVCRRHGCEIARRLFDYGEQFTLNPFELQGAAVLAAQGMDMETICQHAVNGGCDYTEAQYADYCAAREAFKGSRTDQGFDLSQLS